VTITHNEEPPITHQEEPQREEATITSTSVGDNRFCLFEGKFTTDSDWSTICAKHGVLVLHQPATDNYLPLLPFRPAKAPPLDTMDNQICSQCRPKLLDPTTCWLEASTQAFMTLSPATASKTFGDWMEGQKRQRKEMSKMISSMQSKVKEHPDTNPASAPTALLTNPASSSSLQSLVQSNQRASQLASKIASVSASSIRPETPKISDRVRLEHNQKHVKSLLASSKKNRDVLLLQKRQISALNQHKSTGSPRRLMINRENETPPPIKSLGDGFSPARSPYISKPCSIFLDRVEAIHESCDPGSEHERQLAMSPLLSPVQRSPKYCQRTNK
jgi:hypothetical protein